MFNMPGSKTLKPAVRESSREIKQAGNDEILSSIEFTRALCLERMRTERSHRKFVLMLMECGCLLRNRPKERAIDPILRSLTRSTRATDVKGWYRDNSVLGVIFTEVGSATGAAVTAALLNKITKALSENLPIEHVNELRLSFHIFPETSDTGLPGGPPDASLYPELGADDSKDVLRVVKRSMDVVGSTAGLILLFPLLWLISLAIIFTSRGSILFRQERIGERGKRFIFLKFRSMYAKNDPAIHQEYVRQLIAGGPGAEQNGRDSKVYKLTNDPRVTAVGKFLRRTSLDELPQLLNVLKGEMSLVGPRPPVPYEFDCYDIWHRRRLQTVKPGITGMWQVAGRSRVSFDEMVRLDLEYARSWSLWLDIKILLRTPRAVFSGEGAY
jgi:lipopolysaccharide/colanic/teichoic acid biosynthesis glycosyltransferase